LCEEDLYGGVNSPNPKYGSAVTAVAMVLRYYGLITDPGELHTWLTRRGVGPGDPGLWSAVAGRVRGLTVDRWDWQSAPADLRGDSTWWCDWETHWNGWDLALPRDAATRAPWEWYDLVGGADRSDRPHVGAIAVFWNAPNGGVAGAAGHVAYVIGVSGNRFRA